MFALVAAILLPQIAVADTVTTVGYYGPYQTGRGGEFTLLPDAALSYIVNGYGADTRDYVQTGTFQTFCVEGLEYIYPNTTHSVVFNDAAVLGGVGSRDPLSVGAAYLYHLFVTEQWAAEGLTYNYTTGNRTTSADLLQKAIWWLEGEEGITYDSGNNYMKMVYTKFGGEAGAMADNSGQYDVAVLNLYLDPAHTELAQDVLVATPLPGAVWLLGSGLLGLVGIRRRRTQD